MKKFLLFLTLLCTTALGVMAQCDVPTNVQANADHNLVNLSWESSLLDPVVFSDSITYGNTATSGIGTGSAFTFTVAVRFPASMLAGVNGQYLSHVNFVPWQLNVSAVTIKVWTGGSYNTTYNEGTLVSTTNVNITELTAEANNTVRLSTPVQVNTSQGELWIGIEYVATGGYPAGCGSALTAGFNNLIYSNGEWAELTDLNEALLYGWCIAGLFTSSLPEITGFNVFRDNVQLNTTPVTGHNYTDATILGETQYCYTVQSICSGTTSIPSDPACITTPYQPTCYPIGNGTGTCYTHPFNTYYNYSYTQQIYKATEIGAQSGNIVALTFDYFYTSPITMNDITVYMANVNRETFASSSDWLPGSELTQVFHGSVYCSNAYSNKVTINFDDIFEWDGHSNILVAIVNSQGSYENSNPRFYTHTTSGNTVLHAYNDDNTYNILQPSSGNLSSERNNMQFCFGPEPTCYRPTHLTVVNTSDMQATFSWQRHSSSDNSWEVVVVPAGTSVNTGTPVQVSDTFYTATGLSENMAYEVYVRSYCSSTDQSEWVHTDFRTRCVSIHVGVPYYDNFTSYGTGTDAFPYCWYRETTHESISYPYITSTSATTGQMVFFSNASTYSLAVSQGMDLSAYPAGSLALSYWIAQGQATYGRMDIGVMTDPTDMSTFTLLKSYYPTDYHETGYFQEDYILLTESYPNTVYFAFMTPVSGNNSTNITHLSHVKVDMAPNCMPPANLAISEVSGTSAVASWDEAFFSANNYTLAYGSAGQTPTTTIVDGTSFMLTGLTQGTEYEVMLWSNCDNGEADTLTASFTTLAFIECTAGSNTCTITGATTTTVYQLPVNNFYNYSYTQQIFTANEIDTAHTPTVITGVAFSYAYSSQNTDKTDVKIYLAHRTSSTFSSTTDWTPISGATLVYEGPLVCTQGWNTFTFDNDFAYNGSDNLVLIVDDNSGAYNSSSYTFDAHTMTTNSSIYYQSDGTNPDPANPPTGTLSTERNDVKFFCCAQTAPMSCPPPYLYVSGTEAESATLAWNANGSETEWNLEYKAEGSTTWTSEGTVSTSPYTISNLTTDMNYEFRIQAVCTAGDSSEWAYTSAYVPCESVELPIVDNFDSYNANETPSCWVFRSNGTTAAPYVTTAQAYSGTKSLYFYCPSNGNYAYAISPRINENVAMDSLEIMFYAYTATAGYFIEVGIMEDPDDLNSFAALGQFNPSNINDWELATFISRGYAGEGHYVAFRVPQWYANNIYIDNVNIHYIPSCLNVSNIHAVNITPYTAEISWTSNGSESQWNYIYGPAGTVDPDDATLMTANANTITLTDLAANTLYDIYVQANCGDGDLSIWMSASFRTECAPMTLLPYEENFDSYTGTSSSSTNVLPSCWSRYNTGTSYTGMPTVWSSAAHSGTNSMYFYTYSSTAYSDQIAILPEIDTIAIPINTLQLSLFMRSYSTSYPFNIEVGVMTDPSDISTFQLVQTLTVSGTSYVEKEAYFDSFTGNGNFIALKVAQPTSNYNYGYIDDIVLSAIPSCSPVSELNVSNIAGSSALISWSNGHFGTVSSYTLEYSEAGQSNWMTASNNITSTSYMLSGLDPQTQYDVRVSVNCEDGEESDAVVETFYTRCLAGGEVAIGNGTTTNTYLPSYSFYKHTYTQQIFTAAEMGGAANITSVSFEMANLSQQRHYTIYLMHTTETAINAWIPAVNAQQVFSGDHVFQVGWNTFDFSTPFAYNGIDNLLLIVLDDNDSYVSGNSFYTHASTTNCARYIYTDSAPYSITTVPSSTGTALSVKNNVIFGGNCDSTATCFAPNMYVTNITTTTADVNWVPGYNESDWEMEYALYGDTTNWTPVANPTTGTITLDPLTSNTHYMVRMRSNCGGGDLSAWTIADFRTECGQTSIPFAENFNSYGSGNSAFPDCWSRHNTYSTTPYPYISTTNNSGSTGGSLYFYSGTTSYDLAVTPEFNTDVNTMEVTFYLRVGTATNGMIVGVMTDPEDYDSFVPVDTVFCSTASVFEYVEVDMDNYTGTGKFIAFKNYMTTSGALYLDDLNITLIPSCKRPGDVTVSNIDMTSAVVAWTERGNATAWEIEYGPAGFSHGAGTTVPATSNPFTLTGLTAGTQYDVYVRANCGAGDLSDWALNYVSFATSFCASNDQCEYRFVCTDGYGDGWNGAYVSIEQNGVTVATVEAIDHELSSTTTVDTVRVMLCDNVSTTLTWHSGSYDDEASLAVLAPNGVELYNEADMSSISTTSLLTFTTDCDAVAPTCNAPTNLNVSNITENSATVSWTAGGSESSWDVEYKLHSASQWQQTTVAQTSFNITGLTANSNYDVRVKALCGSNLESEFVSTTFTTQGVGIDNITLLNSISLQPNPADNYIDLTVNSNVAVKEAVVYNAFGQLIQTIELNDNHARIDLSNMAAGMYFVRVNGESVSATKKFIKR
ncbi:MAG: fibronectin type III domain-containing protein [Bacteroidales bacterium]|nr:fibronectin type III domain-containing protein [Bacteroidales bacterium]